MVTQRSTEKTQRTTEDVLPNAMIRDILVANPQSAKSTDVLDELNNRFVPMPDPMMEEILAGQSLISDKEVLEGEIASHLLRRQDLFYRLIRSYKADTVNEGSHDSLIILLQEEYSLKAKYLLAFEYLKIDDTANVTSTLNMIPNIFDLSNEQENLQNDYQDYFGVLASLKSENKSILELNTGQITVLQNLSATGREPVCSYARNILLANQLTQYFEPILLPDLTNPPPSKPLVKPETTASEIYFKLYPNPARQYAIIEYSLSGFQNIQNPIIFVITNLEGKEIKRIQVYKQFDQFILNTTNYIPGTYVCTLYAGGKNLQNQKFVIFR